MKTLRKISDFLSFDRSKVPLDRSKKLRNSNLIIWLFRLILDRLSIDRKINSIDRPSIYLKGLITVSLDRSKVISDRSKLVKPEFPEIFQGSFLRFFLNKHASYEHYRLRLMSKLKSIDAIALRFKITYLNLNLNNIITPISVFIKS